MKIFLMALIMIGLNFNAAFAEDKPTTPPPATNSPATNKFEELKNHRLEMIKERLENMTKLQTCITNATDFNAMKTCQETAHPMMNRRIRPDGAKPGVSPRQRNQIQSPTTPFPSSGSEAPSQPEVKK